MCGIAGCYQQADGVGLTDKMAQCIVHRGPDADGSFSLSTDQTSVQLAHRRLAIIDLSADANQPFTKDGLTLCYNGELYNFHQLRHQLESSGVRFSTSSDTEVVLEAWRRWGAGALDRFRGMYAFALFDRATGRLVLARDPMGIKPLFYMLRGQGVVFASELKAIVAAMGDELRVDRCSMVASMLYYWVPDQRCAIGGVRKLQPGTWMEFSPRKPATTHRYWSLPDVAARASVDRSPEPLGSVIEQSVAAHLVSDVPVSSFLSGGLDSSIVTVLAARAKPGIDAYTIVFRPQDQRREAMPDDARYARSVARRYGIALHEIELAPDIAELLPHMVDILDEPIGDPAAINTYLMCDAAQAAGVKVLLSGMGADELFGGYRKHLACVMAARYRSLPGPLTDLAGRAVAHLPVAIGGRGLRYARWAKRFSTFATRSEEAAFRRSYTLYDETELCDLVGPESYGLVDELVEEHRALYEDQSLDDHVNRMCLADSRMFLPGLNLTYTDRASMAVSTEVRVPFVDPDVVRSAFSLSGSQKIKGATGKAALKSAAEAWLPDDVIRRPKVSFGAPLRSWIHRELRPMVDEVLVRGELVRAGFLRERALDKLVGDEHAGRRDNAKQLWQLLTLELWLRNAVAHGVGIP